MEHGTGPSPEAWRGSIAAYIERDTRRAHRHEETGTWVLNRPGMRWFVRPGGAMVAVGQDIEVADADAALQNPRGSARWGFGYRLEGLTFLGQTHAVAEASGVGAAENAVVVERPGGLAEQVTEVVENLPAGIEQRFVVEGGLVGQVILRGRLSGLQVAARLAAGELVLATRGQDRVRASAPRAFGPEGEELPCRFALGDGTLDIVVDEVRGYPVVIDPVWTDLGDSQADARFGFSIAGLEGVGGDTYGDVVVGAPLYDTAYANAGKVYVWRGTSVGLEAEPVWTSSGAAPSGQANAQFGYAVASAGDLDGDGRKELAVGAPYEDYFILPSFYSDAGVVRIYEVDAGGVLPAAATWTLRGGVSLGRFGASLAGVGNVTGTSIDDLLVGSPGYGANAGRISLFAGASPWNPGAPAWTSTGPGQAGAQFGYSVARLGNVNNDSINDFAAGAPFYDVGSTDVGMVRVFYGAAGLPSTFTSMGGPDPGANFGMSIAGDVDVTGATTHKDLIVGAPGVNQGAGRVYVFPGRAASTISTSPTTSDGAGEPQEGAEFGASVSGVKNLDSDSGKDELVVGAPGWDATGHSNVGRVYLFGGTSGAEFLQAPRFETSGEAEADLRTGARLGTVVAGVGSVNGPDNGYTRGDFMVGSPWFSVGSPFAIMVGKAYLYLGAPTASGICEEDGDPCLSYCSGMDWWASQCESGLCVLAPHWLDHCADENDCTEDHCDALLGCYYEVDPDPVDHDGDGFACPPDNCPLVYNPDQLDTDQDGVGDACDNCIDVHNPSQWDVEPDQAGEACDNCLYVSNPNQRDSDGDGVGDACSTDDDADGVPDGSDNCPTSYNPGQANSDADTFGDACDNCPAVYNPSQFNADMDHLGDGCDPCPTSFDFPADRNSNGNPDTCEDADGDGLRDWQELVQYGTNPAAADSDGDGWSDHAEVHLHGTNPNLADTDGDGTNDNLDPTPLGEAPPFRLWYVEMPKLELEAENAQLCCDSTANRARATLQATELVLVLDLTEEGESVRYFPDAALQHALASDLSFECNECYFGEEIVACGQRLGQAFGTENPYSTGGVQGRLRDAALDLLYAFSIDASFFLAYIDEYGSPYSTSQGPWFSMFFAWGQLSNPASPLLPGELPNGYHYSWSIPRHRLLEAEAFEFPADLTKACEGLGCVGGDDCRFSVKGVATAKSSAKMVWTPLYAEISEVPSAKDACWLPEKDNAVTFGVKLLPATVAGKQVKGKLKVTLSYITRYQGYAMNAEWTGVDSDKNAPDLQLDLALPANSAWEIVQTECTDTRIVVRTKQNVNGGATTDLTVNSYDYAAYGKIKAEVLSLSEPQVVAPAEVTAVLSRGTVTGKDAIKVFETTIPLDENNNMIADCGWPATSHEGTTQVADSFTSVIEDLDTNPIGCGIPGDHLTVLEEYRGFIGQTVHFRTNPIRKDYFADIDAELFQRYGYLYESNMGLDIHRVVQGEYDSTWREMNETGKIPSSYIGPHCAVKLGRYPGTGWPVFGTTVGGPGIPCQIDEIKIYEDEIWARIGTFCSQQQPPCCMEDVDWNMTRSVLAHESGHAHSMTHYPWGTIPDFTCMVILEPFDLYCFTDPPSDYGDLDMEELRIY